MCPVCHVLQSGYPRNGENYKERSKKSLQEGTSEKYQKLANLWESGNFTKPAKYFTDHLEQFTLKEQIQILGMT